MFGPEFHIELNDDQVILNGSSDESAGVVLKGCLLLNCLEQTKVKSVSLKFIGISRIQWSTGTGPHVKYYKQDTELIKKEWSLLKPLKKSYSLPQGQYKWDFELPLPGNLPQSLNHDFAEICYYFKAVCVRPAFSMNLTDKVPIKVTRNIIYQDEPVVISSIWANKVDYTISIPSKIYTINNSIPISFQLTPADQLVKVRSVHCWLKEYTKVIISHHQKSVTKLLDSKRDHQLIIDPHNGHWSKVELLHVPNQALSDMENQFIHVKHKIQFTIELENTDGHISELRADIPLIIVPIISENEETVLPAYETAIKYSPFEPTISSSSLPALTYASSIEEDEPYWLDTISCVPSYTTALHSPNNLCNTISSLPNYDAIFI